MKKIIVAVYLLAVSVALLLVLPTTEGAMQGELPNLPFYKVEVDASDKATNDALRQMGAKQLFPAESGTTLWRVPNDQMSRLRSLSNAKVRADYDLLNINGIAFYPQLGEPPIPANLRQTLTQGYQMWVLFLNIPYEHMRVQDLLDDKKIPIVRWQGRTDFVIWATDTQIKDLEALVSPDGLIGWTGEYHPYYRLARNELRALTLDATKAQDVVNVSVSLYNHSNVQASLDQLKKLAVGGQIFLQWGNPNFRDYSVGYAMPINVADLVNVAKWYDTEIITPYSHQRDLDEIQSQIVANNYFGNVNSGQSYLSWLNSKGFSLDPADYPVVSVSDSGFHDGSVNPPDPDFYRLGQIGNGSRIKAISSCTTANITYDASGHGSLIASIVGGYNSLSGFPYRDDNNYQRGLGILPFGRLGIVRVTDNGRIDLTNCNNNLETSIQKSREQEAKIVNTSRGGLGTEGYTSIAQAYDASVRRNNVGSVSSPLLHVIAAGNDGQLNGDPNINKVGAPGVGKNVLTVGATSNPRDITVIDECGRTSESNIDSIAPYSSFGPTIDERIKPDLVAPGTHVQGAASRYESFLGRGVCGSDGNKTRPRLPFSQFYPITPLTQTQYTWSNGTSFAAPAVAGAAQLTYNYYRRILKPGQDPSPAMAKALLINSARPLGTDLPDSRSGWGMVNLGELFTYTSANTYTLDQSFIFTGTNETVLPFQIKGRVADPSKPLKVSLVWTDVPGVAECTLCLINDLDLEVSIEGGSNFRGNNFSGQFSTSVGNFDRRNNVENVYINSNAFRDNRNFIITVIPKIIRADGVPGNATTRDQDFALVVHNVTEINQNIPETTLARVLPVFISDALGGNNNGFVDLNELVRMTIQLENKGNANANAVSSLVTLAPGQPNVEMVISRSDYEDIPTTNIRGNLIDFVFRVGRNFTCGQSINFTQRTVYNGGVITTSNFSLQTGAPALGSTTTYNSSSRALPKAQDLPTVITAPIAISNNVTGTIAKLRVRLNLTHPKNSELGVRLIGPAPNNVSRPLFFQTAKGANFINTIFDDDAPLRFSDGTGLTLPRSILASRQL
jgi:hypothetical protein